VVWGVVRFFVSDLRNPPWGGGGGFQLVYEQPNNCIYNYYIYVFIHFYWDRLFVFSSPNNRFLVNEKPPIC